MTIRPRPSQANAGGPMGDPTFQRGSVRNLPSIVGVGEAVGVVGAGANMDFRCLAHEVVVVDAFGPLAGPDAGEDLREAAMDAGIDERGARGVVCGAAHRDGLGITFGVVVEGAVGDAAICYMRAHGIPPSFRTPRLGDSLFPK